MPLALRLALMLGLALLHHADHGEAWESGLVAIAAVGEQPVELMADDLMADGHARCESTWVGDRGYP